MTLWPTLYICILKIADLDFVAAGGIHVTQTLFFSKQNGNIDPVQSLPYFHADITKEMAVDKLRDGKYLKYVFIVTSPFCWYYTITLTFNSDFSYIPYLDLWPSSRSCLLEFFFDHFRSNESNAFVFCIHDDLCERLFQFYYAATYTWHLIL